MSNKYFSPVITPSPTVASLGKYGNLPVELSTGAATASIGLYDIKLRNNYNINLGLNYSSNGVRVDDITGNTGTGWSFIGAFAIKRMVFDDPDEQSADYSRLLDNGFKLDSLNKLVTYGQASYIDIQPDIFTLIAPGFTGKFYLSGDTAVFFNRNTSYRVALLKGYGFKVTDGNGNTMLYGGDAIEQTLNQAACPTDVHFPGSAVPTSWFLKNIFTNARDTVSFFYSNLNYNYTANVNTSDVIDQRTLQSGNGCQCFVEGKYQCTTDMFIQSKQLDYITTSNYGRISFGYDYRLDNISDKLLKNILVYSTFGSQNTLLRNIRLDYTYGTGKKRPFLSRVANIAGNNSDSMVHALSYNQISSLPDRLDPQTDFWGYYNASTNGSVNSSVAYYGTLSKITYPTGGYDTIFYGSNLNYTQLTNTSWGYVANLIGYGLDDHQCKEYKQVVTVHQSDGSSVRVSGNADWEFSGAPDPMFHQENMTIRNAATGEVYFSRRISAGQQLSYEEVSIANAFRSNESAQLEIIMTSCGQYVYGHFNVERPIVTTTLVDLPFGGVRTNKVISVDRFGKDRIKKYYYDYFGTSGKSSGMPVALPQFIEEFNTISFCDQQKFSECYYKLIHNKSLIDLFTYGNTPMYYTNVTEGYGENFENGGVRHSFDIRMPVSPSTIWAAFTGGTAFNNTFYQAPFTLLRDPIALESEKTYFKMSDAVVKFVKQEHYDYLWPEELIRSRKGYALRQRIYDSKVQGTANFYTQFDVNSYSLMSSWIAKAQLTETTYGDDSKVMVRQTKYYYDNVPENNNVSRKEELTSEKDTTKIFYKYPNDLKGQVIYDSMIARNMIDTITEQSEFLNKNLIEKDVISYNFTNGSNSVIAPANVQIQKSIYSAENWYTFLRYDTWGNGLERAKANDVHEVYIWGYNHRYPIAKILGSTYDQVKAFINQAVLDQPANDQQLRDELNKIRTGLAGTDALVATYTYLPTIGMTSETDPAGKTTFYEYDSLQRLKLVRDKDGKIVKQYDYQYQKPVTQ
ncbi:RHS repeat protein [Chitinophaga agrisoli]|nr:RHS repeat protein [Chitinophaga agrisoli]